MEPFGGAAVPTGTFGRHGIVRRLPRRIPGRGPLGPGGTVGETCRPAHVDVAFNFQRAGNSRTAAGIGVILPPGISVAWSQSCVYTEPPAAHIYTPTTVFALAVDAQRHNAFLGHGLGVGFVHCALTWATMGTGCMCRKAPGGVLPGLSTFEQGQRRVGAS